MPRYFFICIAGFWLLAAACDKKSFSLDTDSPEDNPAVVLVDTITPYIEVRAADSFITANNSAALLGFHDDAYFGRIYSKPYFRITRPATFPEIPSNAVFDSMQLILRPNHYYYGDSLQPVRYSVYRLTEQIELGDRDNYYNTAEFKREGSAVGQFTGYVYPNRTDSVAITLQAGWGQDLLKKIRDKATEISSDDDFIKYLPGFVIEPDSTLNKNILGFDASSSKLVMRLYYHINDITPRKEMIEFPLKDNQTQFNHIRVNRQQSQLKQFVKGDMKLSSKQLANAAYLQPLTGISVAISFPSLTVLKEQGKFVSVLDASLFIRPVRQSYVNYVLPPRLVLKEQDQYGNLGYEMKDRSGKAVQYGNLQIDNVYHQNTFYVYDLTYYIRQQLSANVYETTSLLLLPPAETVSTQLERLVFGDRSHGEYRTELKLYVLIYK
jgi:hypothetical protein